MQWFYVGSSGPAVHWMTPVCCLSPGPHADTASGCQNLQCGFRACCRSGEWSCPPPTLLKCPPPTPSLLFALYPGNNTSCRVLCQFKMFQDETLILPLSFPFQSHRREKPLKRKRGDDEYVYKMCILLIFFLNWIITNKICLITKYFFSGVNPPPINLF